ncbi:MULTISPECIES: EamA family transporter [Xenorhabdus]|uniref:EamA family transporter n=1 Tax=Xenorhabdus TaxID=626 RepID=UPI00064A9704|nr:MULTISPECIES: EamA family transporter [Xenorhabdus]KLU16001.1 4-amino-4-deoxy-L-arabinose-phospho-UDP flippase subunit E [Xenorhabdus griffiniae]KOP33900.1 4-amino-4-deoxy-L-arabinose-phospho-UDP flippase subunit E [Xenorhabdus sp. GDc328]
MFYFVAIICVVGIAVGQVLFKLTSIALHKTGSLFATETLIMLFSAFTLYGMTTIAWIWVLQKIELGKAYPLMALAFIIVPIGSYLFLDEKFNTQYIIGVLFICIGIILSVRS